MSSLILTSSPESGGAALREVRSADPGACLDRWLAPGVGLALLEVDWETFARRFREQPPLFCRHICPVQVTVPIAQAAADLDRLERALVALVRTTAVTQAFSVQTRLLGPGWPYGRYDVNQRLSSVLLQRGAVLDVRQPQQVVSVVLGEGRGCIGVSRAADNLSDWAGGARRFRREDGQISRAEFKLLEAMELFGLQLPREGVALDLGAAPGGWTRILRERGLRVVAVDPGALAPRLAADPGVTHVRDTAQCYLQQTDAQFDVVVNDMRMDARHSAQLTSAAMQRLSGSGWALMTLKLPQRGAERAARSALAILRAHGVVVGARQLFHNRSEVTAAVRRAD